MYLVLQRRRYWALHDVPPSLRAILAGKRRFAANLKTGNLAEAKIKAAVCEAQWLAQLEAARRPGNVEALAEFWKARLDAAGSDAEKAVIHKHIEAEGDLMVLTALNDTQTVKAREDATKLVGLATGKVVPLGRYLDEYIGTLKNERKTIDMKRSTIAKFIASGFTYVADVQRKAVQMWINQQSQAAKAPATIQRALSEMRGYWAYLVSIQVAPEEARPFDRLSFAAARKNGKQDERKPFAPAHVVKILGEARRQEDAQLADLIELGMWTGARLEEICALPVSKVNLRGRYIEIADAKTPAGWRQVPIHSKLAPTIQRLVKASKSGYVLSGLLPNKYGDRSAAIGKRFGRLKLGLGFGAQHVFHSIRKTVATLLEDAHVPENVAADILGHEKPTMTYGLYSGGTSLKTRRTAIEKLDYGRDRRMRAAPSR